MPLNSPQLWIVATPLGNPGDLSPRARDILESVDIVLAEDTRRAGLLFQRCGLRAKRFISFHDHNEDERSQGIVRLLQEGQSAALISDAGTPLMADPGYRLVRACREAGLCVSMVPGPCAPIAALSAAGIAPQPFTFLGFLPRDARAQEKTFGPFARVPSTLVFFERKDRLRQSLATAFAQLGPREVCIARELTKPHEAFILIRLEDHATVPTDLLGEITVIIGPPESTYRTPQTEVEDLLAAQQALGGKGRDIARRVQEQVSGWTGKELYQMLQK